MKPLRVIPCPEHICSLIDSDGHVTATCALYYDHNCSKVAIDEDGQLYCDKYRVIFVEVDDEK